MGRYHYDLITQRVKKNLVLQILATHLRNFKMIFKNWTEIIRMQIYVFVCLNAKRISKNYQSKCKLKQKYTENAHGSLI